ncbi:guanitoxin biosynthesis heme-dependent pre-guanitoxin N-hydroxylase GntA [Rhodanobacter glycinis]|nr:guanitoxin biosynthesis heme-dependent pre-guanitoxin N-hydroxylase GntA [Rhodanobacter glycinis]
MLASEVREDEVSAWSTMAAATERAFEAFVGAQDFPCLGAKASQAQRTLQYLCVHDIASARDDRRITMCLQDFATQQGEHSLFVSLAVLFPCSARLSECDFEAALWQRLRSIHAIDRTCHGWDDSVSDDPASANFSMSVGGKAFYVVGLHPAASRRARRFRCPVLVFNLHSQFERLRADGRYEKLRQAIVQRDIAYAGSANPMLAVHGKAPEARQYSGRQVGADWVCPFRAMDGSECR